MMPETEPGAVKDPSELDPAHLWQALGGIIRFDIALSQWAETVNWGDRLSQEGRLVTPAIISAFRSVRRYDFIPDNLKSLNSVDMAIPIGYDQSISQPKTVASMFEWLEPRRGHHILDFGSGSGWTTALLGKIVGSKGSAIGVERIPELVEFGAENLSRYDLPNTEIRQADDQLGFPNEAPFNRILVSAQLPRSWLAEIQPQLSPRGGRLIAPVVSDERYGHGDASCDMYSVTRHGNEFETTRLEVGYSFVPVMRGAKLPE